MTTSHEQYLAEMEAAEIASMAHMSNADIEYWIDRITAEQSVPMYHLTTNSGAADRASKMLFRYRRELSRRLRVQIEADNAATTSMIAEANARCADMRNVDAGLISAVSDALGVSVPMAAE